MNPQARFSVDDALQHNWLREDEKVLQGRELTRGLTELRRYNARRKLRAGLRAVHLISRMKLLVDTKSRGSEEMEVARDSSAMSLQRRMSSVYEEDFEMEIDLDNLPPSPMPGGQYSPFPPAPPNPMRL